MTNITEKIDEYLAEKWSPITNMNIEMESMIRSTGLLSTKTNKDGYKISLVVSKDGKGIKITIDDPRTASKPRSFLYTLKGVESIDTKISARDRKSEKEFLKRARR